MHGRCSFVFDEFIYKLSWRSKRPDLNTNALQNRKYDSLSASVRITWGMCKIKIDRPKDLCKFEFLEMWYRNLHIKLQFLVIDMPAGMTIRITYSEVVIGRILAAVIFSPLCYTCGHVTLHG